MYSTFAAAMANLWPGAERGADVGVRATFIDVRHPEVEDTGRARTAPAEPVSRSGVTPIEISSPRDVSKQSHQRSNSSSTTECESEEEPIRWADVTDDKEDESPERIAPSREEESLERRFFSPSPPCLDGDLEAELFANGICVAFDPQSGECRVTWTVPVKTFMSKNVTKASKKFKVSGDGLGGPLNAQILLTPVRGSWLQSKGEGRVGLKVTNKLKKETNVSFRFDGCTLDSKSDSVVHDFKLNPLKNMDLNNFHTPLEGPNVIVNLTFLPFSMQ